MLTFSTAIILIGVGHLRLRLSRSPPVGLVTLQRLAIIALHIASAASLAIITPGLEQCDPHRSIVEHVLVLVERSDETLAVLELNGAGAFGSAALVNCHVDVNDLQVLEEVADHRLVRFEADVAEEGFEWTTLRNVLEIEFGLAN